MRPRRRLTAPEAPRREMLELLENAVEMKIENTARERIDRRQ